MDIDYSPYFGEMWPQLATIAELLQSRFFSSGLDSLEGHIVIARLFQQIVQQIGGGDGWSAVTAGDFDGIVARDYLDVVVCSREWVV